MTSNDLEKLPTDVLSNLMSGMTVDAISKLKEAVTLESGPTPMGLECDRAMSVSRYLKETLGYGNELLVILSKCFAYISGSRSLEFFVPGCVDDTSDLDIYVPNLTSMGKAMRMLSGLGVKWHSLADEIRTCATAKTGSVLLASSSLFSLRSSGTLQQICNETSLQLADSLNVHTSGMIIVNVKDNTLRTSYAGDRTGYAEPIVSGVINGTFYHKGKEIKVQLMCERRANGVTGIDGLSKYHSSCVQSFIGGHMACHLYGKMTSKKLTYGWSENANDIEYRIQPFYEACIDDIAEHGVTYIVPAWRKYESRGFRYIQPPTPTKRQRRTLFDENCVTVEYFDEVRAPVGVSAGYYSSMKDVWWHQDDIDIQTAWVSDDTVEESVEFFDNSWFSSDDIYKDQWYLHQHHVACTSLIFEDTEIVPELN